MTDSTQPETNDDCSNIENDNIVERSKPILEEKSKETSPASSIISILLFALIGYFIWKSNIKIAVVITVVIIVHELGHLLAMKLYNYTNLNIFLIPFFGGVATGRKKIVSQRQEVIILLAGPLPGMIIGTVLFLIYKQSPDNPWLFAFSVAFVLINLLNLLPIYPLDGGRMLKAMFLNNSELLSNIFLGISIGVIVYFSFSQAQYIYLIFAFGMLGALTNSIQAQKVKKRLHEDGIDTTGKNYEQLSFETYNSIRYRMVENMAIYKKYDLFEYDTGSRAEKQLALNMQTLFLSNPVKDITIAYKLIIVITWLACFVAPFVIGMRTPFTD